MTLQLELSLFNTSLYVYRYGSEVAEITEDGFAAAGNLTSTARAMQAIGIHPQKLGTIKGASGIAQVL